MKKIFTIILILVMIIGTILLMPLALAFGKSGRETKVLSKDYSLLSKSEILSKLANDFPLGENINLVYDDRNFEIKLSSISAKIDENKMLSTLLYRRLDQGIGKYIKAFFQKREFDLEIEWDEKKFREEIESVAEQIEKPFIPTELEMSDNNILVKEGQIGLTVEKTVLKNKILDSIRKNLSDELIMVPTKEVGQLPNQTEIEETIKKADLIIAKKIIFAWENERKEIEKEMIVNWLGFDGKCNQNKIGEYVNNFDNSIKRDPKDAVFKFENDKVVEFEASKDGLSINTGVLKDLICQNISNWPNEENNEIVVNLPLLIVSPKINTNEANDLGIKELIGRGTSSFSHSSEIRNFNVEKGSSIVNRVLVAPDETFSFIKNLGEVSLDNGYKKAYIIRAGKTELDVGGGICQVSTTLFRAILDAGLPITERKAHAYRVSYYEEDSKPGFDATVFIPNPDLKFKNDTGHHLLIQSIYDGKNKKLTYEIYGTSDGRKAEILNYKQWGAAPAPPDVWIDDPTLPVGKVIKDESRVPGLKTSFDWKVTRDGEIIHQKTFVSSYVPWAAVYRKGPAQ